MRETFERFPEEQSSYKKIISHTLHMHMYLKGLSISLQPCESDTAKELLFKLIDFRHTNSLPKRKIIKTLKTKMIRAY